MLSLLAACHADKITCVDTLTNAINLVVVDSTTGAAPSSTPTVISINKAHTDTVTDFSNNTYFVGFGQSGLFNLKVVASGYRDWLASGIDVPADECGNPELVHVMAKLQR
jgi:hypothetical protein